MWRCRLYNNSISRKGQIYREYYNIGCSGCIKNHKQSNHKEYHRNSNNIGCHRHDKESISESIAVQKLSMFAKTGQFVKSTNTTGTVTQSITGLGFTPKAIIFWGS